jgi:UDP-3-O-[3-hydroxymyristoyl] glucosamine N-acyltransferase
MLNLEIYTKKVSVLLNLLGEGARLSLKQVRDMEVESLCSLELQSILKSNYSDEVLDLQNVIGLGTIGHDPGHKYLTFLDDEKYIDAILNSENIICVITTMSMKRFIRDSKKSIIIAEDPKFEFFSLYNNLAQLRLRVKKPNQIFEGSHISLEASIATHSVTINPGVKIEANVTIYPNVEIKTGSIIRAGAVIGSPGFEYKKNKTQVLSVIHDGHTVIGESVEIGPGTIVGQGFFGKPTIIGSNVKTDNLVSIAHGSIIGDRVLIAAGTIIAGSTTVGHNSWLGPGSVLSNGLKIGPEAFIALGSHVFSDVAEGVRVIGSPARPLPRL